MMKPATPTSRQAPSANSISIKLITRLVDQSIFIISSTTSTKTTEDMLSLGIMSNLRALTKHSTSWLTATPSSKFQICGITREPTIMATLSQWTTQLFLAASSPKAGSTTHLNFGKRAQLQLKIQELLLLKTISLGLRISPTSSPTSTRRQPRERAGKMFSGTT